jgi:hypothetical protein
MEPATNPSNLAVEKRRSRRTPAILTLFICLSGIFTQAFAQQRVLDVGIRVQKTINLYYENGISLQYSADELASQRLYLGLSYVTSRLGTAMGSNAISQDNFLFSTSFFFRPSRFIRPMVRANIGYFRAELDDLFEDLPQNSLLLSSEAGICIDPKHPFKLTSSLGYNFISGDGLKGPGTLFPFFIQTSLSWDIFYHKGNKK